MLAFVLILFFIYLALGISLSVIKRLRRKKQERLFQSLPTIVPGFKADKVFKNGAGLSMIALDQNLKKIFMSTAKSPYSTELRYRVAGFDDMVKVEIIEDGIEVSSKSAMGSIIGAELGGVTGAIVGSNFGKTKYRKKIKNIVLKVLLDDILDPSFQMIFFNRAQNRFSLIKARKESQDWMDILFVIMKRRSNAPNDTSESVNRPGNPMGMNEVFRG